MATGENNYSRFTKSKQDDLSRPGFARIIYLDSRAPRDGDARIVVTLEGVGLYGEINIVNEEDLQEFAYWLGKAWEDHRAMKKAVRVKLVN